MDEVRNALIKELEVERKAFKTASEKTDKCNKHGQGLAAGLEIAATIIESRIKELKEEE